MSGGVEWVWTGVVDGAPFSFALLVLWAAAAWLAVRWWRQPVTPAEAARAAPNGPRALFVLGSATLLLALLVYWTVMTPSGFGPVAPAEQSLRTAMHARRYEDAFELLCAALVVPASIFAAYFVLRGVAAGRLREIRRLRRDGA